MFYIIQDRTTSQLYIDDATHLDMLYLRYPTEQYAILCWTNGAPRYFLAESTAYTKAVFVQSGDQDAMVGMAFV